MTATDELCGTAGIERLVEAAFGPRTPVTVLGEIGRGRGVFSDVYRLAIGSDSPAGPGSGHPDAPVEGGNDKPPPATVVAKLPTASGNRQAAATGGAYRREADAYRQILIDAPVRSPRCHAVVTADATAAVLLEDLIGLRAVDQLEGLGPDDARSVVQALRAFHHHFRGVLRHPGRAESLALRRSTASLIPPTALSTGLDALRSRWPGTGAEAINGFERLVANRSAVVEAFRRASFDDSTESGATVCHGDPRADNLCFEPDGGAVLFDWQQTAIQFAEADVAWLLATSLTPEVRRAHEDRLIADHGGDPERYRLGLALPGLAALLLAQRHVDDERTGRFIAASLSRIGTALVDHRVADIT